MEDTRQVVEDWVGILDDFSGLTPESVKNYMDSLVENYGEGVLKVYTYYDDVDLHYVYKRLENDKEYASRMEVEERVRKAEAKKLEKKRLEYEKLKAYFEAEGKL